MHLMSSVVDEVLSWLDRRKQVLSKELNMANRYIGENFGEIVWSEIELAHKYIELIESESNEIKLKALCEDAKWYLIVDGPYAKFKKSLLMEISKSETATLRISKKRTRISFVELRAIFDREKAKHLGKEECLTRIADFSRCITTHEDPKVGLFSKDLHNARDYFLSAWEEYYE